MREAATKLKLTPEDEDWIRNQPKSRRETLREKLEKGRIKRPEKKASARRVAERYLRG